MADMKPETITLVAVDRGFVRGRMVEPGTEFQFALLGADGRPRKLPSWAKPKGDPALSRPKPKGGDLKPKDAQAASKGKMDGLAGDLAG